MYTIEIHYMCFVRGVVTKFDNDFQYPYNAASRNGAKYFTELTKSD